MVQHWQHWTHFRCFGVLPTPTWNLVYIHLIQKSMSQWIFRCLCDVVYGWYWPKKGTFLCILYRTLPRSMHTPTLFTIDFCSQNDGIVDVLFEATVCAWGFTLNFLNRWYPTDLYHILTVKPKMMLILLLQNESLCMSLQWNIKSRARSSDLGVYTPHLWTSGLGLIQNLCEDHHEGILRFLYWGYKKDFTFFSVSYNTKAGCKTWSSSDSSQLGIHLLFCEFHNIYLRWDMMFVKM